MSTHTITIMDVAADILHTMYMNSSASVTIVVLFIMALTAARSASIEISFWEYFPEFHRLRLGENAQTSRKLFQSLRQMIDKGYKKLNAAERDRWSTRVMLQYRIVNLLCIYNSIHELLIDAYSNGK